MAGPPSGYTYPPGYPAHAYYGSQQYAGVRPSNGIGIAAGVCGIIAVVFCWIPFVDIMSIVLGALAIVFGFIGNNRANTMGGSGKGLAITGIVCGIVAVLISILFMALIAAGLHSVTFHSGTTFPTPFAQPT